jgi:hypothetical protein
VPDGAEPLAVADVSCAPPAAAALAAAWAAARREGGPRCGVAPLYEDADGFTALVLEVLGRDIRSAHQRERAPMQQPSQQSQQQQAATADAPQSQPSDAASAAPASDAAARRGRWRVVLDGVNVGYELDAAGCVTVTDAEVAFAAQAAAEQDTEAG